MDEIIKITGLTKRYGEVVALNRLDLGVKTGSVLALLGPNGAGKTTAIRVLTTLLEADEGEVHVAGIDVRRDPDRVRELIGLSGQTAAVDEHLTGFENLDMVGRLYHLGRKGSRDRARELLERFDLVEAGDRPAKTYSGGMRRRLDLAAALVAKPAVLFLDEPTTGLDPRSRSQMWEEIQSLVKSGATVLLTTQYLEEADRLADDIIVIDRGRKIAQGNADALKAQVGGERIEIIVAEMADIPAASSLLRRVGLGEVQVDEQIRALTVAVDDGMDALARVLKELEVSAIKVVDLGLRRPTLDDVFLTLTGHLATDDEKATAAEGGSK